MKVVALLLVTLISASLVSGRPPADLQQRIDAWIKDQPGGIAVAWVDADATTFFQAGHNDGPDSPAITPDTTFELGSITKVFTALLLAESERAGKASRSDPAARYLLPAGDPAQAKLAKVTLLSLTTHTAGLSRMPPNFAPTVKAEDPYAHYELEQLLEALRLEGMNASGHEPASYSNFGVSVLGQALAGAWGTTYAAALQEHVLTPLGLKATTLGLSGQPVAGEVAQPHAGKARAAPWTFAACAPAGALRSTARDMALFLESCLGRRKELRDGLAASFVPQAPFPAFADSHIGLGWFISGTGANSIIWHNGLTMGSHSFIGFDPQAGRGVVILTNEQKGPEELGFALLSGEMPKAVEPATGGSVANAGDYPGSYRLGPRFAIAITAEGGELFGQATAQPRFAMRPDGTDRFAVVGVPAQISFERGADGKVIALTLHQGGRDQRAPRGELPPAPKSVTLPPETLAEYSGRYPLAPTFVLTVTVENGAVQVQATGQAKLPVYASARDEFFYSVVDAQISFTRDPAGKVTGLVLHQNGRDLPAEKAK